MFFLLVRIFKKNKLGSYAILLTTTGRPKAAQTLHEARQVRRGLCGLDTIGAAWQMLRTNKPSSFKPSQGICQTFFCNFPDFMSKPMKQRINETRNRRTSTYNKASHWKSNMHKTKMKEVYHKRNDRYKQESQEPKNNRSNGGFCLKAKLPLFEVSFHWKALCTPLGSQGRPFKAEIEGVSGHIWAIYGIVLWWFFDTFQMSFVARVVLCWWSKSNFCRRWSKPDCADPLERVGDSCHSWSLYRRELLVGCYLFYCISVCLNSHPTVRSWRTRRLSAVRRRSRSFRAK